MMIPDKIDIQIFDITGQPVPIAHVLFGLKLFNTDDSWLNYSVFKTGPTGHITLTKKDIIENTELKSDANSAPGSPTNIELYVWDGFETEALIKGTLQLLELYLDEKALYQDLKEYNVAEEKIPAAMIAVQRKAIADRAFYDVIKDAVNNSVQMDPVKVEDTWEDAMPKYYRFVVG